MSTIHLGTMLYTCTLNTDQIETMVRWSTLKVVFNTSTAGPRYICGCCLMLERRYGFRAGT